MFNPVGILNCMFYLSSIINSYAITIGSNFKTKNSGIGPSYLNFISLLNIFDLFLENIKFLIKTNDNNCNPVLQKSYKKF